MGKRVWYLAEEGERCVCVFPWERDTKELLGIGAHREASVMPGSRLAFPKIMLLFPLEGRYLVPCFCCLLAKLDDCINPSPTTLLSFLIFTRRMKFCSLSV